MWKKLPRVGIFDPRIYERENFGRIDQKEKIKKKYVFTKK